MKEKPCIYLFYLISFQHPSFVFFILTKQTVTENLTETDKKDKDRDFHLRKAWYITTLVKIESSGVLLCLVCISSVPPRFRALLTHLFL